MDAVQIMGILKNDPKLFNARYWKQVPSILAYINEVYGPATEAEVQQVVQSYSVNTDTGGIIEG